MNFQCEKRSVIWIPFSQFITLTNRVLNKEKYFFVFGFCFYTNPRYNSIVNWLRSKYKTKTFDALSAEKNIPFKVFAQESVKLFATYRMANFWPDAYEYTVILSYFKQIDKTVRYIRNAKNASNINFLCAFFHETPASRLYKFICAAQNPW